MTGAITLQWMCSRERSTLRELPKKKREKRRYDDVPMAGAANDTSSVEGDRTKKRAGILGDWGKWNEWCAGSYTTGSSSSV